MQNLKESNKFLRQCIFCRTYKPKTELIRITKDYKTKQLFINNNSVVNGRSVYICNSPKCIENTIKKKIIERMLKSNLPEIIKEELSTVLKN